MPDSHSPADSKSTTALYDVVDQVIERLTADPETCLLRQPWDSADGLDFRRVNELAAQELGGAQVFFPRTVDWGWGQTGSMGLVLCHPNGADTPIFMDRAMIPKGRSYHDLARPVIKCLCAWKEVAAARPGAETKAPVELVPAGFAYRGRIHTLTGRQLAMLRALVQARHHRSGLDELRDAMGVDDEAVNYPEQVVKDTATELRKALLGAVQKAGLSCKDPLPSIGRGKDLVYTLELP
jgi:hypothetical protein